MRINFHGQLAEEKEIRAGFIGCGSHSFRNIYPVFQFAPVDLVSVCDLSLDKARMFVKKFGAKSAYGDYKEMLQKEKLDAVFCVTGYDKDGRPTYPQIAKDCLEAGCHVWMEKPPAATCKEIEEMQKAALRNKKNVGVGFKKMYFPANEKAHELMGLKEFGKTNLVLLQYPQVIPEVKEMQEYLVSRKKINVVVSFLDHLCHPVSLMIYLLGMPETLYYDRSSSGSGVVVFKYESGTVVSLSLNSHTSVNMGIERTTIYSDTGRHIVVDNNIRVFYQSATGKSYGNSENYYSGELTEASKVWEPEFSLGQLYNKGMFIQGFYGEIKEFAASILEKRSLKKAHLGHALQITKIFEAFLKGPNKVIKI